MLCPSHLMTTAFFPIDSTGKFPSAMTSLSLCPISQSTFKSSGDKILGIPFNISFPPCFGLFLFGKGCRLFLKNKGAEAPHPYKIYLFLFFVCQYVDTPIHTSRQQFLHHQYYRLYTTELLYPHLILLPR